MGLMGWYMLSEVGQVLQFFLLLLIPDTVILVNVDGGITRLS